MLPELNKPEGALFVTRDAKIISTHLSKKKEKL